MSVDRERLSSLMRAEIARFEQERPRSRELFDKATHRMPDGVPMLWMAKWPGPWPVYVDYAQGAHFTCVDGIDHVDLCLGDTGAMVGHSPKPTVDALSAQLAKGITTMLPTEDAEIAAGMLAERFGVPMWQFTLTATDANRAMIRYCRAVTGKKKVLVMDYCYHGSVDETFATLDENGAVVERRGNIGAPVPPSETTVVVPFNDVPALEAAFATGEIACVLVEPAMTNIGIVLPEPGWHDALRELATRHGAVLIIDETHTLCAGPGGMTQRDGLRPDAVVVGKTIAGGIPAGAYGMTQELGDKVRSSLHLEDIDVGGVGGTLAGNALSLVGIRATLGEVLTPESYPAMIDQATRWTQGVSQALEDWNVPWQVTQLGTRAEYSFLPHAPHDGGEAAHADDFELQQYLHLHALNRGILMTPFHNMALMSPATSSQDVDAHTAHFREAVESLFG
ncbi:MAG: aminotransferase class III-fold pyridoxal phosphate-dependent enzyme [Microbacteriaceae bacterium]|nr:aminotransferase class III-fold pyridoxal phosphate-dependent enzyme [Microbacteriaceae bacterium]